MNDITNELGKIRWPQKGDNPFMVQDGDRRSPAWISLNWLASMEPSESISAEAFKEAADKLVSILCEKNNIFPSDKYFMPVTYLYRHSLEIKLKEIINLGLRLELIEQSDEISDVMTRHRLIPLWKHARRIIEKHWPHGQKEDVSSAAGIIQAFHNIDKSGQNLRYPKNRSGEHNLENMPKEVELNQIKDVFAAIYNFLDGCDAGLNDAIDYMHEGY